MYKHLIIEQNGGIYILKIDSPATLNALNSSILREIDSVFDSITEDDSVRVVIITGSDRSFVAGADIQEMSDMNSAQAKIFGRLGADVFKKIALCKAPVIAAINGFALGGGCELALACDIRIASDKARIGQPEVGLGIIPGFSGTQRLARLVGVSKAKELIFSGRIMQAEEALSIGLLNRVVPHDLLMETTLKIAESIALQAPIAVQYAKEAIDRGLNLSLDGGIELETELFSLCFDTSDQKAGMLAFLRKERYQFKGK